MCAGEIERLIILLSAHVEHFDVTFKRTGTFIQNINVNNNNNNNNNNSNNNNDPSVRFNHPVCKNMITG